MVILNENISRNSGKYNRPISIKASILKMVDGPFAEEERLNWKNVISFKTEKLKLYYITCYKLKFWTQYWIIAFHIFSNAK